MKQRDDPEVAAWLSKACGDLRMAGAAVCLDEPLWDQACFHSQQAREAFRCAERVLEAVERLLAGQE